MAYINSFQHRINWKVPAVARPGKARGSIILKYLEAKLHPSKNAASSISLGMDLKNSVRINVDTGSPIAQYTKIKPVLVS